MMSEDEFMKHVKSEAWTSYNGQPWTGPDPEVGGDNLLIIRRPSGIGSPWATTSPGFLVYELADYVVALHNLAREHGGIEELADKAWRYDELDK